MSMRRDLANALRAAMRLQTAIVEIAEIANLSDSNRAITAEHMRADLETLAAFIKALQGER